MTSSPRPPTDLKTLAYLAALVEERAGVEGFADEIEARALDVVRARAAIAGKREAAEANASKHQRAAPKAQAPKAKRKGLPSRKAQMRILEELRQRWMERGDKSASEVELPPWIDWRVRSECDAIVRDGSGREAQKRLCTLPGLMRHRTLRVLREGLPEEASRWAGLKTERGARLVACAWATWRLARDVVGGRGQPWAGGKVVEGYARAVWCLLVRTPRGEALSVSTLWGTHCGSKHVPGPMSQLARAGAWTRVQPPAGVARFVGPSGWAVGQMWLGRRLCGRRVTPEDEREHGAELLELLEALGLLGPS